MGKTSAARKSRRRKVETGEPLVNQFAQAHGDYQQTTIPVTAGEFDGESHGQKRVTVNRGGTTLQRWVSAGMLNQSQVSAITLYSRAWHRIFTEPRVSANLSPIAFIRTTGDEAERNAAKIDAMELLKFLDERIFQIAPPYYFDVWQDVIIYGRESNPHPPEGQSRTKSQERQKTICLFIADIIAKVMRL